MPQVTVTINNRNYTVACGDGEEQHLLDLASYYDKQIRIISEEVGQVGDTRLLLLGALMIADQLSDMVSKIDELRSEVNRLKGERTTYDTGRRTPKPGPRNSSTPPRAGSARSPSASIAVN